MFKLLYLSTASELFSDDDLYSILHISRENNATKEITGMLLYHDGSILQVLEGAEDQVMTTFHHICKDPRHQHAAVILTGHSEERIFAGWTMGFRRLSAREWNDVTGYIQPDNRSALDKIADSTDRDIYTFIRSFHTHNFRNQPYL